MKKGILKKVAALVMSLTTVATVSSCAKNEEEPVDLKDYTIEDSKRIVSLYDDVVDSVDELYEATDKTGTTKKVKGIHSFTIDDMDGEKVECEMVLDVKAPNGKRVTHALTFDVSKEYASKIDTAKSVIHKSGYKPANVEKYLKSVQTATEHAENTEITTGLTIPEVQELTGISEQAKDRIFNYANSAYTDPDSENYDLTKSAQEMNFYTENKSKLSDMTISVQSKSTNRYATVTMILDDKVYSVVFSAPTSSVKDNEDLKKAVIKFLNNPNDKDLIKINIKVESAEIASKNDTAIWETVKEVTKKYEAEQTNDNSASV